jgi:hypothetical protein
MRNKYPGVCYRCHQLVAVGGGHFERFNGGWRTQHATCAILHRDCVAEGPPGQDGTAEAGPGMNKNTTPEVK